MLLTDARYRSKQAATEQDPFAAIYAANVDFPKRGQYAVLSATKGADGKFSGATSQVQVSTAERRPDPLGRGRGAEGPDGHAGVRQGRPGDAGHA